MWNSFSSKSVNSISYYSTTLFYLMSSCFWFFSFIFSTLRITSFIIIFRWLSPSVDFYGDPRVTIWPKKALEKLDNSPNVKVEKWKKKHFKIAKQFFFFSHKKYGVSAIKRQIWLELFTRCQKVVFAIITIRYKCPLL